MAETTDSGIEGLVDIERLGHYLDEIIGDGPIPLSVRKHTAGYSNITLMIDRGPQQLVMRRPPGGNLLPSAHDVGREYRFVSAVYGQARVPRPVAFCEDLSVIGAPFFVMERVIGTEIRDTIPAAYDTPEGHAKMAEEIIDALVELHAVDVRQTNLSAPPGTLAERQLRRWLKQWELTRARTRELPGLDRVGTWLQERMPPETEVAIAHGDWKVDNLLFDSERPRLLAILDWELATLGDPLSDIAWLATTWGDRNEALEPGALPPATTREGFPEIPELIAMYGRKSGRDISTVPYFQVLALFKGTVISEGIYMRYLEGNAANPLAARMEAFVPRRIERMQRLIDGQV